MDPYLLCLTMLVVLFVVVCVGAGRVSARDQYHSPDSVYFPSGRYGPAPDDIVPQPVHKHLVRAYSGTGYNTQNIVAAKNYSGALDTYPGRSEIVAYECRKGVCVPKRGGKLSRRQCLECCGRADDPC